MNIQTASRKELLAMAKEAGLKGYITLGTEVLRQTVQDISGQPVATPVTIGVQDVAPATSLFNQTNEANAMNQVVSTPETVVTHNAQTEGGVTLAQAQADEAAAKKAEKEAAKAKKAQEKAAKNAEKTAKKEAEKAAKAEAKAAKQASKPAKVKREAMPEQNGVKMRRPGTSGARIWDAATGISSNKGSPATIQEVLAACTADNENQVKCEYAAWRKYWGISGRVTAPKVEATATNEMSAAPEQTA